MRASQSLPERSSREVAAPLSQPAVRVAADRQIEHQKNCVKKEHRRRMSSTSNMLCFEHRVIREYRDTGPAVAADVRRTRSGRGAANGIAFDPRCSEAARNVARRRHKGHQHRADAGAAAEVGRPDVGRPRRRAIGATFDAGSFDADGLVGGRTRPAARRDRRNSRRRCRERSSSGSGAIHANQCAVAASAQHRSSVSDRMTGR
jgi:hypothetical protein